MTKKRLYLNGNQIHLFSLPLERLPIQAGEELILFHFPVSRLTSSLVGTSGIAPALESYKDSEKNYSSLLPIVFQKDGSFPLPCQVWLV